VAEKGGGVVYFPAGIYTFRESIALRDSVILRGAEPAGVRDARQRTLRTGHPLRVSEI